MRKKLKKLFSKIIEHRMSSRAGIFVAENKDQNNNHIKLLKDKHAGRIVDCKKSTQELVLYIKNKFDINDNDDDDVYIRHSYLIETTKINCLNSIKGIGLREDDLDMKAYEIIDNESSSLYYPEFRKDYFNESICVVLDMTTGYIECSSRLLKRELFLYRGISEHDIENDTPDLVTYLLCLDEKQITF